MASLSQVVACIHMAPMRWSEERREEEGIRKCQVPPRCSNVHSGDGGGHINWHDRRFTYLEKIHHGDVEATASEVQQDRASERRNKNDVEWDGAGMENALLRCEEAGFRGGMGGREVWAGTHARRWPTNRCPCLTAQSACVTRAPSRLG